MMFKNNAQLLRKVVLIIALAITTFIFTASTTAVVLMYDAGYYESTAFNETSLCQDLLDQRYYTLVNELEEIKRNDPERKITLADLSERFALAVDETPDFEFLIYDNNGDLILKNVEIISKINKTSRVVTFEDGSSYNIVYSLAKDLTQGDSLAKAEGYFNSFAPYKWVIVVVDVISFFICAIMFIYLMCLAGHRDDSEKITLNSLDKIPLEIYMMLVCFLGYLSIVMISYLFYNLSEWMALVASIPVVFIIGLLILATCMTIATRFKANVLLKNTLIFMFFSYIHDIFANTKLISQVLWMFAIYGFLILFNPDIFILATLVFLSIVFVIMARAVIQLDRLFVAGEKLAKGDLDYQIDTRRMKWKFKKHANDLNHIRLGISKAVDSEMKSERLKTELITNVSHDIKTPLTSIINYVDLLKKENIDNDTVKEYLEVLDRQSKRLKKMTEDLVEASKASTGNMPVSFERINIIEFIDQAVGEFTETFQTKGLSVIVDSYNDQVYIAADGKLLWRVFDNLFNNIYKYAQNDTRIYINVSSSDDDIVISIKNISAMPLNISADELMERFVRGDSSRTTDGSGLGLSITRSLLQLQKAKFKLDIDGDLFKATITFAKEQ